MADIIITVVSGETTNLALAVPGSQGPVGLGFPSGGTTNQVLFKQSSTNYDATWGNVTSAMIGDLSIVDADINASAAIAGTKISPSFGSQTIATTGVFSHALGSAAAPTVTFTGDLNTGIYSPTADNVSIATAGVERLRVDAAGQIEAVSSGTAAAPVYAFVNDADTGVYLASGNTLGITTSGVARVTVDDTIAPIKEVYSSVFYPVVTQTDIGTAPDQVPLAGMLGDMAFTNYPFWRGGSDTTTTSGVVVIDALVYERFNYTASMATGVTVRFSNLGNGREVKLYMRNTNATGRPVSLQASTSSSGHTAVNLSTGSLPGAPSVSGVTLSGSTGTALVWVGNINGTIVGGLC